MSRIHDGGAYQHRKRMIITCKSACGIPLILIAGIAASSAGYFVDEFGVPTVAVRPKVVGVLRLGGKPVEEKNLRHSILVYFSLIAILFVFCTLFVMMTEPESTWGASDSHKLLDVSSAVISTLNNIGPGLGIVGATENYSNFSFLSKTLFIWLMMLGRLEIFPVLVLFAPGFWSNR